MSTKGLLMILGLTAVSVATPQLRLGLRYGAHWGGLSENWYDSTWTPIYRITYDDSYHGAGLEAEYGPVWAFRFRTDLAEARFFLAGGASFVIFPAAGLDVFVEPPFRWRVLPYVWGGCQLVYYGGHQEVPDQRFIWGPDVHWRAGAGVRYSLNTRIDFFGEIQGFAHDTYRDLTPDDFTLAGSRWVYGSVGLCRAQVGVRLAVGGQGGR